MHYASDALLYSDLPLIEDAIEGSEQIIEQSAQLRADACGTLGAQTPVAGDLCAALTALDDVAGLEHMATLAIRVASMTLLRFPGAFIPHQFNGYFTDMARTCVRIATQAKHVVLSGGSTGRAQIAVHGQGIDDIARDLSAMVNRATRPLGVGIANDITLLSRYYEEFADHAIDIANREFRQYPQVGVGGLPAAREIGGTSRGS
ncbi:phosphate uptake regulator PhoU [Mycobacterium sp. CBMA293]|uniref:phosphate uptake regulator PhoU n=1 Tax=unclassified Mycolicibacterium TaxID=2636767 RepID=UPI0012DFE299|nr:MULTISPECIES: phosphate uptake regulator PhoU [unclassified Mycolicibacterium]MUL47411.1 phosphate uptake regulator PhoU [Mycolicibacterium sp. CBMA 360]MUL59396.1 phosphate uptake regulator PhoU [Mycolicibacterium sp. CBMA 335]MUL71121.1 phosphate uptake regulator PhoU [Mycolicibacterium sp. CBMA 311]MUL94764.1 phosphate uptake regulator PhoU [Mycolicibacterium sp. CBMA 230]MUM11884.1 phosphate uptake regulator PhoU [Mycolicibacterium sp. CBMA 293]